MIIYIKTRLCRRSGLKPGNIISDLILKKCTHSINKIQSIINVPYETSKIAFFLLVPEESTKYSGGYKTLLQYINYLNDYGLSVDVYFVDRWEHMESNERGFNLLKQTLPRLSGNPTNLMLSGKRIYLQILSTDF